MANWGYGLLGPVEARVGGCVVPLTGVRQRLALAVLLLGGGHLIPAGRLIDELWDEALPADPPAALRTQISRLRHALGPVGGDLVTGDGGYRLRLQRHQLDAFRFEDSLSAAAQASGEQALEILDEGLALWRGPALAEFAGRPFAQPEAVRLDELRVAARERRGGLLLALGLTGDAVAVLQAVVTEHPDREHALGLLMQALYQQGRHTEALATFRSWRRHLAEDLGLDPSPELLRIEQDILRHAIAAPHSRGHPLGRALPLPVTSFVGRDEDIAAITALLGRARLLTLHGPGGVGKTRLALEVATRAAGDYPGGVCFCDLAAVRRPAVVTRAIATAAELSEVAFRRLDDQLVEHLAGRRVLLILDNCDHLVHAVAVIAERLLRETRTVTVLATSRERLQVDGEHLWPVRPLTADGPQAPAVGLFLDRARAAGPAATREPADVAAVAALCARLDGLPLAIELAAARLLGTTISELAGSLDDRFAVLTAGRRADSRHHSLRAVVDWSYHLLTPTQRRLFDQLAVFHGSFDAAAARAVADHRAGTGDVSHLLLHLVDSSLVMTGYDGGTTGYRLLETLRSYGLQRLSEQGEQDAARGRHAQWAADLVTLAARGMRGANEASWTATLDRHLGDLRAAHSWLTGQDTELGLRMTAGLHWYALWRCQPEVFRWAEVAAAAAAGSRSPFYPEVLASAAFGALYRGDLQAAETAAHAAFDATRGMAPISARRPLEALGDIAVFRGDLDRAAQAYREAYGLSTGAGDFLDAAWDAASAAAALTYGDHLREAARLADQASAAASACGAPSALALVCWVMGEITAATSPGQARHHLQQAIALARPAGSRLVAGLADVALAALHARDGDSAAALRHYQQVIPEWQRAGAWAPQWVTIRTLIYLLTRLGAYHDAATLYGAATCASTGAPPYGPDADRLRESATRLRGELTAAEFRSCVDKGKRLNSIQVVDLAAEAIARASART